MVIFCIEAVLGNGREETWGYNVKERLVGHQRRYFRVLEALNLLGNTAW